MVLNLVSVSVSPPVAADPDAVHYRSGLRDLSLIVAAAILEVLETLGLEFDDKVYGADYVVYAREREIRVRVV